MTGFSELKPCPFCGAEPSIDSFVWGEAAVYCECGAEVLGGSTEDAIGKWEKRI